MMPMMRRTPSISRGTSAAASTPIARSYESGQPMDASSGTNCRSRCDQITTADSGAITAASQHRQHPPHEQFLGR